MSAIIKTNWDEVKDKIKIINKNFFNLIESISSVSSMPLYLATYDYGKVIGSKSDFFIPDHTGNESYLGSNLIPNEIAKDLDYGKNSSPLGLIMENFCEWSYEERNEIFPFAVQGEGTIFNQQIIFQEEQTIENNTISLHSGVKSIFMLPNIGCKVHHKKVQLALGIESEAPKDPNEHYALFREILYKTGYYKDWHSTILFFSKQWIDEIRNNPAWLGVKFFFSENLRKRISRDLYNSFYNDLFMTSNSVNKHRPTPFLIDTAKYIFNIIMGKGIGYIPAQNSKLLPIEPIQEIYHKIYQLTYSPILMVPSSFNNNLDHIYYSLQQPSKKINTFKIRMNNSTYQELAVLRKILLSYLEEFSSDDSNSFGSDLYWACQNIKLSFFHNKPSDPKDNILLAKQITEHDLRFQISKYNKLDISNDAKFFRGCLRISRSNNIIK
ncbi:hypothetical protein [Legionella sp. 227]|uniref:hypothetical protein n=1 Tax=Legionella sp. 227 TaxID=3367288 RepID=UPI00370D9F80